MTMLMPGESRGYYLTMNTLFFKIKVGDAVIVQDPKHKEYIVGKVASGVEYAKESDFIDSQICRSEMLPFRRVKWLKISNGNAINGNPWGGLFEEIAIETQDTVNGVKRKILNKGPTIHNYLGKPKTVIYRPFILRPSVVRNFTPEDGRVFESNGITTYNPIQMYKYKYSVNVPWFANRRINEINTGEGGEHVLNGVDGSNIVLDDTINILPVQAPSTTNIDSNEEQPQIPKIKTEKNSSPTTKELLFHKMDTDENDDDEEEIEIDLTGEDDEEFEGTSGYHQFKLPSMSISSSKPSDYI
eukprot:CAMPEP_0168525676 /NCGR_PEP_ID=MMETSP0405-20121227/11459_1 /TAXON_ID=498012 /ORGANISM="Trichosphaerium sp, Strain Am-I-7 wt" /LENGTH=299 /DNA_ID=CAMNT_0008548263 /DNA_START=377 /DNA_END=1273 /DNA_ORIENTATION=-